MTHVRKISVMLVEFFGFFNRGLVYLLGRAYEIKKTEKIYVFWDSLYKKNPYIPTPENKKIHTPIFCCCNTVI